MLFQKMKWNMMGVSKVTLIGVITSNELFHFRINHISTFGTYQRQ